MREEVHQPSTAITKAANPKLQEQSQDDSRLKKKPITAKVPYVVCSRRGCIPVFVCNTNIPILMTNVLATLIILIR